MIPAHPHSSLASAQMCGFGVGSNLHTTTPTYHFNGGFHHLEQYGHNMLTQASNALGFSRQVSQFTTHAESPVSSGPWIVPPNSMGDSTPITGSSAGGVPTPEPEAEPSTQVFMEGSGLSYDKLLESYRGNNGWDVNPTFNTDFNPFSMIEL